MSEVKQYTRRPFVYQGKRWGADKKLYDSVQPLEDDRATFHGDAMLFECRRDRRLIMNGLYEGAEFYEGGARGLSQAQYSGEMWHDNAERLGWRALDDQAEASAASHKMERDARRSHDIQEILLPLRKLMHSPAYRNDPARQQAVVNAVTRALRVPPRANED